jgi:hypothetical protein
MRISNVSNRLLLTLAIVAPTVLMSAVAEAKPFNVKRPVLNTETTNLKQPNLNWNSSVMLQLVQDAKDDPEFFRRLVSNPKTTLAEVDYLDPRTKNALTQLSPEALETQLEDAVSDCGSGTIDCGKTIQCGHTISVPPYDLEEQILFNQLR